MAKLRHSASFHRRGAVSALVLVPIGVLVAFSTPIVHQGTLLNWVFQSLGWVFLTLCATFRLWATLYIGGRKDRVLQTEGAYSVTRNPLYLGSACQAVAVALFFQSLFLLFGTMALILFFSLTVVRSEEVVLRGHFGAQFDEYARETPRFFPNFSRYRRPKEVMVDLDSIRREARRMWLAALLPIGAGLMTHLRDHPNWPHWFKLP